MGDYGGRGIIGPTNDEGNAMSSSLRRSLWAAAATAAIVLVGLGWHLAPLVGDGAAGAGPSLQAAPPGTPAAPAPTRSMHRPAKGASEGPHYREMHAVVVGINYKGAPCNAGEENLAALKNAENDAAAFADLLVSHFGYRKENVHLLRGKEANRAAILDQIEANLCHAKRTDADSVLFFYAGHGHEVKTGDGSKGCLLPWDVGFAGKEPKASTLIEMESVVAMLRDSSHARHKLAILDCCHAGCLFGGTHHTEEGNPAWYEASQFQLPAFQGIVASRAAESAADGRDGHSPFTEALLYALRTIPRRQGLSLPLRANDVFWEMKLRRGDNRAKYLRGCAGVSLARRLAGRVSFLPPGRFQQV